MECQSNRVCPLEVVFRPAPRERERRGSRTSDAKKNNVMTPTRCRSKHQETRGRGAGSQTRVKMVRNDRRAQHRVLFRDMRADVPRGPLADCRLAGDVPRPWREGSTDQRFERGNRGREAEARTTPIRIAGTEPEARLVMQGVQPHSGGSHHARDLLQRAQAGVKQGELVCGGICDAPGSSRRIGYQFLGPLPRE